MKRRFLALSLALAPLAGCHGGNTNFWLPRNDLLPMVALDDRVAFVETSSQTAFLLDPADPSLTPRQVPVGKTPIAAVKRNGANNQLLVLTKGDRGSAKVKEVAGELDVIAADPTAPVGSYPLTGRFDGLAQSGDGRFVVLYHTPASQSQNDTALSNPNEMTLIDFTPPEKPAVPKVTPKTIRSMGGVPNLILFSPSYTFTLGGRTLAVVLSQNYVTILDLDNPGHTEISVPLCPQPSGCNLTPVDAVFDPDNLNIYVRASGAKDIYQIKLTDLFPLVALGQPLPDPPANDFLASLSMLAVGSTAADMALYGAGKDHTHLAVAAADTKSLVIIDPSTSSTVSIATSIPVSRIIPFIRPALSATDTPRQQALLVDLQRGSTSVIVADLEEVETTGGLPLSDFSLAAAASEAHLFLRQGPLLDQNFVVLVANRFSGSAALTVVDLASRSFSTFDAGSALALPTFETRNPSRLWSADSRAGLFHLNLVDRASGAARLTIGETSLDQDITSIVPLATSSTERKSDLTRYLVVGHNDPDGIGNLTILDAENPDRANARTAYGFLLSNYLEREQP